MHKDAAKWIAKLNLKKHPEGGYFRETYRSEQAVRMPGYDGARSLSSAIYYLLAKHQLSAFHKIKSDEIWHHYAGGVLSLQIIKDGRLSSLNLGRAGSGTPQILIEKGCWMAASISSGLYCLVGCTVSPGFDFRDWELAKRRDLLALFPRHRAVIEKHTTV
ncbi:MAG: cupin domain-containing protein [Nitrososphaera sp.]